MADKHDGRYYMGNENLPNRNWKGEYTPKMIKELKEAKRNILKFAERYFYIVSLDAGKQKIKLYPAQKKALRDMRDERFYILLASRQIGKSTLMTIYLLWQACFEKDQRILLVANKEATAIEIFSRVRMAYEELPNWLKPPVKEYAKTSMTLENGSRIGITTTTGTAARGQSVNCLVIDEMAFIEPHLVEEFWKSVYPIISSSKKSKAFICSTANGTQNLFYKIYNDAETNPDSVWNRGKIMWNEVPGRDEKWAAETRASIGSDEAWRQEFCCEWINSGESSLDDELYEKMEKTICDPKVVLDDGAYKIWEDPDESRFYAAGIDTAEGVGKDSSVIQVLDITDPAEVRQVAVYRNNKISPLEFSNKVYQVLRNYGSPLALIERNNCGAQVVDRLVHDMGYPKVVSYGNRQAHRKNRMYGMIAHTNTKHKGVMNMRYWMNDLQSIVMHDAETLEEFKDFVRYPNGTWKAQKGRHDDLVMAIMYGYYVLDNDICEQYFEIIEKDDTGRPKVIEPMDFGIQMFEDPTSIYSNENMAGASPDLNPVYWGMSDGTDDDMGDDYYDLLEAGFTPL